MVGRLGARLLPCFALWSACDGRRQADESALFQKEFRLHRFIDKDVRAQLTDKIMDDPTLRSYFRDVADVNQRAHDLFVSRASRRVADGAPNGSVALFSRQFPGMGGVSISGAGGVSTSMGADQMDMISEILDALASDDFIRNFTAMNGAMEDLAKWFNTSATGHMDLYLETTENVSREEFAADTTHFVRKWENHEMEFMLAVMREEANFAGNLPRNMFKKDYGTQMTLDLGNFTLFIEALESIQEPNMTGNDGSIYCPFVGEMKKADASLGQAQKDIAVQLRQAKRMLPMVGRMFGQLMPEDDEEAQEMTPRLLFMMGVMLNSTESMITTLADYSQQMTNKLAPLMWERLACEEQPEIDFGQSGGAFSPRNHFLAAIVPAIVAWVSLRQ